jgi:glycosyltransferase involved in cell wall biosynthesis
VSVAPVLPQDVRHQGQALCEAGLLDRQVSSLAYAGRGRVAEVLRGVDRVLGTRLFPATERRRLEQVPERALASPWLPELWTRLGTRLHLVKPGPRATDRYLAEIDRAASRQVHARVRLVIGREDSCLRTFGAAKRQGAGCLYDLPTAHHATVRAIMSREEKEFPGASLGYNRAEEYSAARNARKDRELAAVDHVLVPSAFVRASVLAAGVAAERVTVIPFGCQPLDDGAAVGNRGGRSPVLLYVGHVSLRKGAPRLLRAWKRLGAHHTCRLHMIGDLRLTPKFLADYSGLFEHVPRLPRGELARHYATAHALVTPGPAEGFAVVITEALSHGLPAVASQNSGAEGFITHGQEGLLYPFDDDDKLCAALDHILTHPDEVGEMGHAAVRLARRWTWSHYRQAFVHLVWQLLGERNGVG